MCVHVCRVTQQDVRSLCLKLLPEGDRWTSGSQSWTFDDSLARNCCSLVFPSHLKKRNSTKSTEWIMLIEYYGLNLLPLNLLCNHIRDTRAHTSGLSRCSASATMQTDESSLSGALSHAKWLWDLFLHYLPPEFKTRMSLQPPSPPLFYLLFSCVLPFCLFGFFLKKKHFSET